METFTFNIEPLTSFLKDDNTTTITCKDIFNIICKCYNIDKHGKINIKSFIFEMCKDSNKFKKKEDTKHIAYFIDITISIIMINKHPVTEFKNKLIDNINNTMDKLFQ